jgi:MoaA/NifB/PqqE/SkfB family radical SAM enzyme
MNKKIKLTKLDILRLKGIINNRPIIGPREVNIHINNACQRKCIFCWYFSPLVSWKEEQSQLPLPIVKNIVSDCAKMKVQTINFEGGEVTLYPHLKEAFQLVKSKGFRLITYSHLAFPDSYLETMKMADSINVNLSASSSESCQRMHGDNQFNQVINNLICLNRFKTVSGKPDILLSFIITELNYHEIEDYIRLADRLKVKQIKFKLHIATKEMKQLVITEKSTVKLKRIISRIIKKDIKIKNNLDYINSIISADGFLKKQISIDWSNRHNDRLFYYKAFPKNKIHCFVSWFYSLIDVTGRVIAPCDNTGYCVAGNVYKDHFSKIWFDSDEFKRIRNESMARIDIRQKKWYECRYCGHANFNIAITGILKKINPGLINIAKDP